MSAPTPGPGWREINGDVSVAEGFEVLAWSPSIEGPARRWVLAAPRPLPTELGTVIRIEGVLWMLESMGWRAAGADTVTPASDLEPPDFDVVAVPPAVTATAVLDRLRQAGAEHPAILDDVAAEYGIAPTGA